MTVEEIRAEIERRIAGYKIAEAACIKESDKDLWWEKTKTLVQLRQWIDNNQKQQQ